MLTRDARLGRWIGPLVVAAALGTSGACDLPPAFTPDAGPAHGPADPLEAARRFVDDAPARRDALEASVAPAPATAYASERLAHYAVDARDPSRADESWERLEVYPPLVRPYRDDGRAAAEPFEPVVALDALVTLDDWVAAGREAYRRFPLQPDLAFEPLREPGAPERYGLSLEPDGRVRGLVEVEGVGGPILALTCAGCHDAPTAAPPVEGASNGRFRYGDLVGAPSWAPGTMDVTADEIDNPVRPSDLRPLSAQRRMHHAGNLENGRLARMVRVETLMIGRFGRRARPDRRLVAAIVLYLDSLREALPAPAPGPGVEAFERECAGCHAGPDMVGEVVDATLVGTDPAASRGARGFGVYRVPSLLGAAGRERVLHDGSAAGLAGLLGLVPSEHIGHPFGRAAPEAQRRAILESFR